MNHLIFDWLKETNILSKIKNDRLSEYLWRLHCGIEEHVNFIVCPIFGVDEKKQICNPWKEEKKR